MRPISAICESCVPRQVTGLLHRPSAEPSGPFPGGFWENTPLLEGRRLERRGGPSWRPGDPPQHTPRPAPPGRTSRKRRTFTCRTRGCLQFMSLSSCPIAFHVLSDFTEFSKMFSDIWMFHGKCVGAEATPRSGWGAQELFPAPHHGPTGACPKLLCEGESVTQDAQAQPPTWDTGNATLASQGESLKTRRVLATCHHTCVCYVLHCCWGTGDRSWPRTFHQISRFEGHPVPRGHPRRDRPAIWAPLPPLGVLWALAMSPRPPAPFVTAGGWQAERRDGCRASPAGPVRGSPVTQTSDDFIAKISESPGSERACRTGSGGSQRSHMGKCSPHSAASVRIGGHVRHNGIPKQVVPPASWDGGVCLR